MANTKVSLASIVEIYLLLRENAKLEFLNIDPIASRELDVQALLEFFVGYDQKIDSFLIAEPFDFTVGSAVDSGFIALFKNSEVLHGESPIKSFNIIKKLESGDKYESIIYLDSRNNHCWRRFSLVKEACHVLFLADQDRLGIDYPEGIEFRPVFDLIQAINTLPFSVYDFSAEKYSQALAVENAAEVLAFLVLCTHEALIEEKNGFQSAYAEDPFMYDYLGIAEKYMVPRRYMELFLTNDIIGEMLKEIDSRYSPSPFGVVPSPRPRPRPKPTENDDKKPK